MKSKDETTTKAEALVESLEPLAKSGDVFEAFEELDALPPEIVQAVLTARLGHVRAPEELDSSTRLAHDFPAPALRFVCTRVVRPTRLEHLSASEQEQVKSAGTSYDGLDLPADARLAGDGSDTALPSLEHWTIDDEDGVPQLEVVRHHGDSGAIFRAGTSDVIGVVAHGTVELGDRRERRALQIALDAPVDEEAVVSQRVPARPSPAEAITPPAPARRQLDLPLGGSSSAIAESTPPGAFEPEPETTKMKRPKKAAAAVAVATEPAEKKQKKSAEKTTATKKTATSKKTAAAAEKPTTKKKATAAKTKTKAATEKAAPKSTKAPKSEKAAPKSTTAPKSEKAAKAKAKAKAPAAAKKTGATAKKAGAAKKTAGSAKKKPEA